MDNLSHLLDISALDLRSQEEIFETLLSSKNVLIKRIVSFGQTSNEWYNQQTDEFVILLQGKASIMYENGDLVSLQKGDSLWIKAHEKHKVTYTSASPPCIWIAIFFENK
ncbi:MAG: cupin domain-containing protein [Bacteroidales bacterium]|jgi:cupin 2 domain-containing protein|nr:cupin domain-containing protein [Bacteroidales bacterium]